MSNLRWVADYFVKCHYSDVLFAGQVGDVGTDHGTWVQAEALPTYRPSFFLSPTAPGKGATWPPDLEEKINTELLALPRVITAKSHREWPSRGLSRGTPDPYR